MVVSGRFKRGVRGVGYSHLLASTLPLRAPGPATMLSHKCCIPLLVKAEPNCVRQSLASTVSARVVAATSCCHPARHVNVVTHRLLTPCLYINLPNTCATETQSSTVFPLSQSPLGACHCSESAWNFPSEKGPRGSENGGCSKAYYGMVVHLILLFS